jgi:aminoglycoside 6'-N-acetyltransferase I
VTVSAASPADAAEWAAMRHALWPDSDAGELADEISQLLAEPGDTYNIIARVDGDVAGFAEASLRHDYVNGCKTSPVAFLEGIYVKPAFRGRGIARALTAAVERWARERGCREFASDALLDNTQSQAMHRALGFDETRRVVYFRKTLD